MTGPLFLKIDTSALAMEPGGITIEQRVLTEVPQALQIFRKVSPWLWADYSAADVKQVKEAFAAAVRMLLGVQLDPETLRGFPTSNTEQLSPVWNDFKLVTQGRDGWGRINFLFKAQGVPYVVTFERDMAAPWKVILTAQVRR